jgi:hypothetical protein
MRPQVRHDHDRKALLRNAFGGLLFGVLLGYVAAWVLPRRRPAVEGSYEAPVPARLDLPEQPGLVERIDLSADQDLLAATARGMAR